MNVKKIGFLQALGVTAYISLVAMFFWQASHYMPKVNQFLAPIMFLLLLSVSVLVCGLLVFYKPYTLFFSGKKKEAIDVVLFTTACLVVSLVTTIVLVIIFKG